MTVIKDKQSYNYPKPNSNVNSDTESLHLGSVSASDAESLHDEPIGQRRVHTIFRPPAVRAANLEEHIHIKRNCGKKKLRRYENRCTLQTLNEEDENDGFIVIMESYKSPFSRLLEDKQALEYWNDFIDKPEEEQYRIIKNFNDQYHENEELKEKIDKPGHISSRIRRIIKIRRNLSLEVVKMCEEDLITFFKTTPNDVYIKHPPTSFDRLLLHGIAQYHRLKSISGLPQDGKPRSIEVYNTMDQWTPVECYITDFIKHLRKNCT
ncbi:unnamed protein product [Callosobruchus maculatus]|uniref:R3H-associated N-terminal domain-containing protein n=1 Tax=Callosobruchus maculatus TaxID=64391 RepID=A0A653C266_CALMS|nr:unnamed protein product [Callosobruchus maculatus]